MLNPADLILKNSDYYHFAGSLDYTACTKARNDSDTDTITASAEQIELFKRL